MWGMGSLSRNKLQRLIDMLHFIVLWMRGAVGSHDSIDEKMPIVGCVTEVTAISPEFVGL